MARMAKPRSARPASPRRITFASASYPRALVASQLVRVRALCRELPDVTERPSHGSPTFFVGKRTFAYFLDNHHGDGRLALWCAAPEGAQAMLVDSDPEGYFLPPYVAHRGWVGVRLDRDLPWNQIASVLEAAHQMHHRPPRAAKPARSSPARPARSRTPAKPVRRAAAR
jgi:hypothetical protein